LPAARRLQVVEGSGICGKCIGGAGDVNLNLYFGGATAIVPLLYGGCIGSWAQGDGFVQLVSIVNVDQVVVGSIDANSCNAFGATAAGGGDVVNGSSHGRTVSRATYADPGKRKGSEQG